MGYHKNYSINDNAIKEFDDNNQISSSGFDYIFIPIVIFSSIMLILGVVLIFMYNGHKSHERAVIYTQKQYKSTYNREKKLSSIIKYYSSSKNININENLYKKYDKEYKKLQYRTDKMNDDDKKVKKLNMNLEDDSSNLSKINPKPTTNFFGF